MSRKGKGLKDVTQDEISQADEETLSLPGHPARVMELVGRVGVRGEATQVRCKILDGRRQGKVVRRNVKGPVRLGDLLMLKQTDLEASPLTGRKR